MSGPLTVIFLSPEIVGAGIYFLDDEKTARLDQLTASLDPDAEPERYLVVVAEFLLREVGLETLHEQWLAYQSLDARAVWGMRDRRPN